MRCSISSNWAEFAAAAELSAPGGGGTCRVLEFFASNLFSIVVAFVGAGIAGFASTGAVATVSAALDGSGEGASVAGGWLVAGVICWG